MPFSGVRTVKPENLFYKNQNISRIDDRILKLDIQFERSICYLNLSIFYYKIRSSILEIF